MRARIYCGLWLSLVERLVRDQEAVGSNPTSPMEISRLTGPRSCHDRFSGRRVSLMKYEAHIIGIGRGGDIRGSFEFTPRGRSGRIHRGFSRDLH